MIRDSGETRTVRFVVLQELDMRCGRPLHCVLLESPEPDDSCCWRVQNWMICGSALNFTCLLSSEQNSLCEWQSRKGQSPRPQALCEFLGCELPRLFCGNSHPSNSHSASHRGEAETAVADSTSRPPPPPSKPSYLEGVLKLDCIRNKS
jgi:hypothetical protein